MALLANGLIWTLVVWATLIFALLQDDRLVWHWLFNAPGAALAAPLLAPDPQLSDWQAPGPTATANPSATPTRVVSPPQTLPEMPAAPLVVPSATTAPLTTTATLPAPSPTVTPLRPEAPSATEPAARPTPQPAPARAQVVEEAAIVLSQPDNNLQTDTEPVTGVAPTPLPWPAPADPLPSLTEQQLAQAPTRLLIPGVGIDSPVVPVGWEIVEEDNHLVSVWQVAEYAVGWHQNSAMPGQIGNTVLSGHSNVSGEVFRHLADVHEGDRIIVMVGDRSFEYEATLTTIVKEAGEPLETRSQNARWIAESDDERLTLVTCWPYPDSTHRFIVVASPV